ncbi:MAG TPA: competence/damage-inducible protein A [Bacteroidota bacterium]|nr:competence/damage-inducible protein A [Bacteroidota bacterium]
MNAELISIGDELLIGQVINTNQAFIAEQLNTVGISVTRMTTVGDREQEILASFNDAWKSHDIVVVTGGLGPTHDDITRSVVCKFFNTNLVRNETAFRNIERLFASRGLPVTPLNEQQALVPAGCVVIQNTQGTASGYLFEKDRKTMVVMPGVPYEMTAMMENFVIPHFSRKPSGFVVRHRTLKTTGIAESLLAEKIGDVNDLFVPEGGVSLAFLPSPLGVRLRISVRSTSAVDADRALSEVEAKLRAKAHKYIYGTEKEELEEVVGRLLLEKKMTIAVAESCTGGLIMDRLTDVPGSSAYFLQGSVLYSNESKISQLAVPEGSLLQHGAVSREVAEALAAGVRNRSKADIGLSTTGIAGPSGGTAEKPVGLVWIGFSDNQGTFAMKFNFGTHRRRFKERTSQAALELVRRKLLTID